MWQKAQYLIHNPDPNQGVLFSMLTPTDTTVDSFVETLSNGSIRVIGPELIFGTLFEQIGLNEIPDELFRHMVIARLVYPTSKLKTVDYLYRYKGIDISVSSLYKSLDRLHKRYKQH